MDHIKSLFGEMKKQTGTERGELFKYFITKLNPPRIAKGFRPLTYPRMGKLLQGIETKDLYYLKTICEDSKNFSARFFWELDPKKHNSE